MEVDMVLYIRGQACEVMFGMNSERHCSRVSGTGFVLQEMFLREIACMSGLPRATTETDLTPAACCLPIHVRLLARPNQGLQKKDVRCIDSL